MSRTDIDKWINGETEVFFDPRRTAPATSDSNRRNEGPPVRRLFWKFTRPAIVIGVAGLGVVTVVGLFTSTRYSGQPFAAADTMPRHIANPTIAMGVSRADEPRPNLHQWTTTLSDAGITTVLKDWVDPPVSPPVPSAALPPRETVARPAPPEPRTNAKREDRPPMPPEASTPRVDRSSHTLLEQGSSSLSMANPAAHPLSSNNVARVAMPEALPLPEQANEFINSYW
jgi:hypothetical protein